MSNNPTPSSRAPRRLRSLLVAALMLSLMPALSWASPPEGTGSPLPPGSSKTLQKSTSTSAVSASKKTEAKKAKAKAKKAKAKKAKAKKAKQKKLKPPNKEAQRPSKKAQPPKVVTPAPALAPLPNDLSTTLPHTMRDEITGDFMGLGYDQHARVEDLGEGAALNIYDPPDKGGALRRSSPTDLLLPNRSGQWPQWAQYGDVPRLKCNQCFQNLDSTYHLSTILLATDGRHIYMTGTTGSDDSQTGAGDRIYHNIMYSLPYDGSCGRDEECDGLSARTYLPSEIDYSGTGLYRFIATVSLAATIVNGQSLVAVGLTDGGVQIYTIDEFGNAVLGSTRGEFVNDGHSQTPTTAMAFDSSGLLFMGVSAYSVMGWLAQVNSDGTSFMGAQWELAGDPGTKGFWAAVPLSAAWVTRPDGSRQVAVGMSDSTVRIPDFGPNNGGRTLTASPALVGTPMAITPVPNLFGSASTYAVAVETGPVTSGGGYLLADNGSQVINPQTVTVDSAGNASNYLTSFDNFRSWFPGYRQGAFSVLNNLNDPVTVTLQASSDMGRGCWFAPGWPGRAVFPASDGVTLAAGARSDTYSMGAYTAGSDGTCGADPSLHPAATWHAYLVVTPVNRNAEALIVDLILGPQGWSVDIDDQQGGGSLKAAATVAGGSANFGNQLITISGDATASGDQAPYEVSIPNSGKIDVTATQLTPTPTTTYPAPAVYRFDVDDTSWLVPANAVQATIPPLQVEGLDSDGDWVDVGRLLPNGQPDVSVTSAGDQKVTVPGATFYWENTADTNAPHYSAFQVVTTGPNPQSSSKISLSDLSYCYSGTNSDPTQCQAPPSLGNPSFDISTSSQSVMNTGLDQAKLTLTLPLTTQGELPTNDDAFSKVFYRQESKTGALVTNLVREDLKCESNDCFGLFVGVQPTIGAYRNDGTSTYGRNLRGSLGGNVDYVSTTVSNQTTLHIYGVVRLVLNNDKATASATINSYGFTPTPFPNGTATAGFGFTGCPGEGTSTPSCTIAPTSAASPSADGRGALYVQAPVDPTGFQLGVLLTNQAQDDPTPLPLQTAWTDTKLPTLDSPAVLKPGTSGTVWKLKTSSALTLPSASAWLVTHGSLVNATVPTS